LLLSSPHLNYPVVFFLEIRPPVSLSFPSLHCGMFRSTLRVPLLDGQGLFAIKPRPLVALRADAAFVSHRHTVITPTQAPALYSHLFASLLREGATKSPWPKWLPCNTFLADRHSALNTKPYNNSPIIHRKCISQNQYSRPFVGSLERESRHFPTRCPPACDKINQFCHQKSFLGK
jgi:hypothetical protein